MHWNRPALPPKCARAWKRRKQDPDPDRDCADPWPLDGGLLPSSWRLVMLIETKTGPVTSAPSYTAYKILQLGFITLPILAGLDKFFHLLADWEMYLSARIVAMSPLSGHNLMLLVGAVEILAGLIVAIKP